MAKRIVDEEMRFSIVVNGNEAQAELYKLEKSTRELTQTNKDLRAERAKLQAQGKRGTEEYKRLSAEIKQNSLTIEANKARMSALQKEIGITGLTMNQLRKEASLLRLQLANMVPGTEEYDLLNARLRSVNARMAELRNGTRQTEGTLSRIANGVNKYGAMAAGIVASLTGVVLSIQKTIDYQKELADAQSDVQKTTGMTKQEVDDLSRSFGVLNTRTSRINLLKIAEEGGRIGIAKDEIKDFVAVMDQAVVALSDSFPGGVEETASKLGKLKLLFKETKDQGVEKAYLSIGSAINELGANGVATESNIAEFATRVGSLPEALKPSISDALALGAAFEESGIQAEIASRAYGIVLKQASEESQKFADVMGITNQEVKNLINEDPLEFMIKFAEGLKGMNATETAQTLGYLGVSADGANKVLGAISNNTQRFREQLALSSKAMKEATSLTNEFNTKNNNLAANLDKIKKTLIGAFNSEGLTKALTGLTNWFGRLIGAIKDTTDAAEEERAELFRLQFMIFNVNTTTSERVALINKLKTLYPDLLKDINAETVSNQQLKVALKAVNDQLINKIIIAREQDKIDKQNEKTADRLQTFLEKEMELREAVGKMAGDTKGFSFNENKSELENAIALADQYIENAGKTPSVVRQVADGYFSLKNAISGYKSAQYQLNREQKEGNELLSEREALMKRLGIKEGEESPVVVTPTDTEEEEESNFKVPRSGDDKKVTKDESIEILRQNLLLKAQLIDDAFLRELATYDTQHQIKMQKLSEQLVTEGKLTEEQIKKNGAIRQQMRLEQEIYEKDRGTFIMKGLSEQFKAEEDNYQRQKTLRQTKYAEELAAYAGNKEAQKELQELHNKEELEAEAKHLEELVRQFNLIMEQGDFGGFDLSILTPEQKAEMEKMLEDIKLKLAEVKAAKNAIGESGDEGSLDLGTGGKIDIFGFSAQDWVDTFTNLETVESKINAAGQAVQGFLNAWTMYYQYVNDNENRHMREFERKQNRERTKLKNSLDSKMINQRQYDQALAAMEADMDKRKADLEYKQAKRAWKLQLANAIATAAMATINGFNSTPFLPVGLIMGALAATLGTIQVGIIAKNKPVRGYETGWYPDTFPVEREQDGKVFNARYGGEPQSGMVKKPTILVGEMPELIVSAPDLKKFDPEVVSSIGREIRRVKGYEQGYTSPAVARAESPAAVPDNSALLAMIAENTQVLREIKEKGLNAWLVRDMENAKKLQDDLDKLKKYKQKSEI